MLLDTNAISAWAKGDMGLFRVLQGDRLWYLPSIGLGEFRFGVVKSHRRGELEHWLEEIEPICVVLSPDATTARHCAIVRAALEAARTPIPYHDIWIAALALQHAMPVVTRDAHFGRISGLRRIGWVPEAAL